MDFLTTISSPVTVQGIGLHSGHPVTMTLQPGAPGTGIVFVRTDLGGAEVPAVVGNLARTSYATTLEFDGVAVATVEHVLSAVVGLGIDDLRVELDAGEVPILDGSAALVVRLLEQAGIRQSEVPRQVMRIQQPVTVREGDKSISIAPGRGLKVRYAIAFDHPAIGESHCQFILRRRTYIRDIAPARTFCRLEEVEALREAGLARGGSLENALVLNGAGLMNGPLRYRDEFVRHKILDLLGDLALLGLPLEGSIRAERAGHALHTRLVRELIDQPEAWSLVPAPAVARPSAAPVAVPA